MWENEFEKKVHQKMEEFKLRPDPAVWEQVKERIHKERKRRFIFWWFLVPLLLAGGIGGGVWLNRNKNDKNKNNNYKTASVKTETIPGNSKSTLSSTSVITAADSQQMNNNKLSLPDHITTNNSIETPVTNKENSISQHKEITAYTAEKAAITSPGVSAFSAKNSAVKKKEKKNTQIIKEEITTLSPANNPNEAIITSINTDPVKEVPEKSVTADAPPIAKITATAPVTISTGPAPDTAAKKITTVLQPDTVAAIAAPIKLKNNRKWQWGISAGGGRSATVSPIISGSQKSALRADVQGAPSPLLSPYASTNNSLTNINYGASFQAGVFAQKQLAKRWQLQVGAGYTYLSTRKNIGRRVDRVTNISNLFSNGVVDNYYTPGDASAMNAYRNQYHFVYLSADISWRIINGKKFKLDWKSGIQYSRLIGSTMLHYDYNLPGYYKDNSLLEKNQVFLSTGLSLPVTKRLIINPFVSYSPIQVLKKTAAENIHYSNFGIRIQFLLKKK
jgi:hypothetical protein